MKCSPTGLDFIHAAEGCKLTAYPDPGTKGAPYTIGVGHTGGVKLGDRCTDAQAREWLASDVGYSEHCVNKLVIVDLKQTQFDALVSLVFNIGCEKFSSSTLLRLVNAGDDVGAALEFRRWNYAGGRQMPGLTRRRNAESEMFAQ